MRLQDSRSKAARAKAFSNLRLLTFLFIFFIFVIAGTTVIVIGTKTRENIISLTRDEIRSEAAIAALAIDGDALAALRPGDETAPSYLALRDQLRSIRGSAAKLRYVYTMRRNYEGVEFVVDADYGFASDAARIGQPYPETVPELYAGFYAPTADTGFTTDQWGSFLSGYAPVRNSRGEVVGIVGIDMEATDVVSRLRYLDEVLFLVSIISILAAVVGIIVIERRRSIDEELIVANRNYLTQIFESVQAGILIVDAQSHEIIDANPTALALIGARKEDVLNRRCPGFICPEREGNCPVTDLRQDLLHTETALLTCEGGRIPVIKYVLRIVLDNRPCLLETFIDITDRKRAEEDLLAAVRKLKVLSVVTRNDILSDVYALAGYLELTKEEVPGLAANPLAAKIDWVMERIREKSVFFRDYDEAGTRPPVWQEVSGVVNAAAARQKTSGLSVQPDLDGLFIFADQLFYKVIDNLLDNTARHGVNATSVRISCFIAPDKSLVLVYEDNGVGVSPADKERIFERGIGAFTGLGLFLAREILGITGITIRECGEPGKGARFEMTVPEGRYRFSPVKKDQDQDNP